MKKYIVLLILFASFSIAHSATLKKFYYKDYGYVDRLVFVFSVKPKYRVLEDKKQIQIELTNTLKSVSIVEKESFLEKNIIIKSIRFLTNKKNILVLIDTRSEYYLKKTVFVEGGYKIVLDIFKSKEATTIKMHKSYASFYSTVGYRKKARWHLEQAKLLEEAQKKSEPPKEKTIEKETPKSIKGTKPKEKKVPLSSKPTKIKKEKTSESKETKENFYTPQVFIYSAIIIVGFILLIWGTIALRNKLSKTDDDVEKEGLGDKDFDTNLVIILLEKGWKIPEIAREVNLSEKTVKKIKKENKDIIKR